MKRWGVILAGLVIGAIIALVVPESWIVATPEHAAGPTGEVWACPMLCVKLDRPGTCPVCGMDLERIDAAGAELVLDKEQQALIGLRTAEVTPRALHKRIRTFGEIDFNERRVRTISAWAAGRIERLYADHTFVDVRAGDHVMQLYSPALYAAQQEYLVGGTTRDAARRKLELLGLTAAQIATLDATGAPTEHVDILSPITGKVIELKVKQGDYVQEGTPLYTVADYSSFWLRFDAYEADLPWLAVGLPVEIWLDAAPGQKQTGTISFIEGVVNAKSRTTKVRVTVDNDAGLLRPGMYANVVVMARVGDDGTVVKPSLAGRYTCYMHPSVRQDGPGDCPICGMDLELVTHEHQGGDDPMVLSVPESAVLSTGKRHVVYVEKQPGIFELREVRTGVRAGGFVHVLDGLDAGEVVATRGNFLIDSQMQLSGNPSLLMPSGGAAAGHAH